MSDQHRQTLFIAESIERRGILWRIQERLPGFAPAGYGDGYFALGWGVPAPYNFTGASA
ncbi:hypothetical protein [Mesorhizobium escarrei]|uniref:hypothetical protein n=1 Tax=Mesorhizobium escarrei TaxID=666018 RepID=UPI0020A79047|nr:hypothetical protein [Mesorhizobium escarrei]